MIAGLDGCRITPRSRAERLMSPNARGLGRSPDRAVRHRAAADEIPPAQTCTRRVSLPHVRPPRMARVADGPRIGARPAGRCRRQAVPSVPPAPRSQRLVGTTSIEHG